MTSTSIRSHQTKLTPDRQELLQRLVSQGKLVWEIPSVPKSSSSSAVVTASAGVLVNPENHNFTATTTTIATSSSSMPAISSSVTNGDASTTSIEQNTDRRRNDKDWPRHYAALLEYYKEHGTCNVPQQVYYECELPGMGDEEGEDFHYIGYLGLWLANQRRCKRGLRSALTPKRDALLQALVDEGMC